MKWWILFSLWAARLVPPRGAPLRTASGWLQGVVTPDGAVVAYYGVPYAMVHSRFQPARPDLEWEGVLQAQDENVRCTQWFFTSNSFVVGREDCLTLNVYTPAAPAPPRPVMVFIHGGGFKDGSGSSYIYGPEYLLQHDVILVTINYRLDVLGFLCLGIPEAPGNVGLKDQVLALRWVQKNIKVFGGDPDNITIFGESAGAASVSYHLLSPMSRGLFKRAILQSGTALAPWALQQDPIGIAHRFAKQIGKDSADLHELVKNLKNFTGEDLLRNVLQRAAGEIMLHEFNFTPCVEEEIPGIDRFLPDYPYKLLLQGNYNKVPVIIGYNNQEGLWFVYKENDTMLATFDFTTSIPGNLEFSSNDERIEAGNKFKSLYLPNSEISKESREEFSRYEGDLAVIFPVSFTIELLVKTSQQPVFAYEFTHDGSLNVVKRLTGYRAPGAAHADDLFYLFKTRLPLSASKEDRDVISKITTMWTNFAKYSDPTPRASTLMPEKWKVASERDPFLFIIDNQLSHTELFRDERLRYWRTLYTKHWRKA